MRPLRIGVDARELLGDATGVGRYLGERAPHALLECPEAFNGQPAIRGARQRQDCLAHVDVTAKRRAPARRPAAHDAVARA